jgi:hypothetical protein
MSRWTLYFLAALSLAGIAAPVSRAQNTLPLPPPAPSATQTSSTSQTVPVASAKKVWTNEDVGGLRDQSKISTFVASSSKARQPVNQSANPSKGRDAKWYHDQIARLQAQVLPLDSQIADLQSALNGTPTGDSKSSSRPAGVRGGDWRTEMTGLEAKRDDMEARIGALRDEARHQGIPAEALP